jgi:hypothetical protein
MGERLITRAALGAWWVHPNGRAAAPAPHGPTLVSASADDAREWLTRHPALDCFHVTPGDAAWRDPEPITIPERGEFVIFSIPRVDLPLVASRISPPWTPSWYCSRGVLTDLLALGAPAEWNGTSPVRAVQRSGRSLRWPSTTLAPSPPEPATPSARPPISRASRVLAVVPYYACEEWLALALSSLAAQTRPPDAVVVVDDGSPVSPRDVVAGFPNVTLVRAEAHGGQWQMIQRIIDLTDFDAYLHQDADDFSSDDRLELLLDAGERTGASLIGTQALQLDWMSGRCSLFSCPTTVPRPSREHDYSVLHPTSIVTKALVERVGGFATALPFGGDTEFQHRVRFTGAGIANVPRCCYFKIVHSNALTVASHTGMSSPAREQFRRQLKSRFASYFDAATPSTAPDLSPLAVAPPVALRRICGPPLGPL